MVDSCHFYSVFFQWILCVGIWCVGLAINIYQGAPRFEPIAMLGGIIWCTGNLLVVPIVSRIGLSLGLLIWGGSAMIMGWASGVFGLMGINKQTDNIHSWYAIVILPLSSIACPI
jgi:hypothetical protein